MAAAAVLPAPIARITVAPKAPLCKGLISPSAGKMSAKQTKGAWGWHGASRDGGIAYLNLSLDKQFQRNCTALTTPQSKIKRFLTAPLTKGSLSETGTYYKNRSMIYHRSVYLFYNPRTKCRRIFLSFFPVFPAIDPIFRGKLALKVG